MTSDLIFFDTQPPDCPTPWNTQDAQLAAQGWTRRSSVAPDRLREVVDLYQLLGFDVHLADATPDPNNPTCAQCPTLSCGLLTVVYTRKK